MSQELEQIVAIICGLEAATHPSTAQSNCPQCPQERDKMAFSDHRDKDSEDGRAGLSEIMPGVLTAASLQPHRVLPL